jgi:hypothetical protein
MDGAEIKRRREELEQYFNSLYDKDKAFIIEKAKEYSNGNKEIAQAYLDGYKESIKNPHTRIIRLIVMYTLDYIPYYKKIPTIRHIATCIRDIFRDKLYPKGLFEKVEDEDPDNT